MSNKYLFQITPKQQCTRSQNQTLNEKWLLMIPIINNTESAFRRLYYLILYEKPPLSAKVLDRTRTDQTKCFSMTPLSFIRLFRFISRKSIARTLTNEDLQELLTILSSSANAEMIKKLYFSQLKLVCRQILNNFE